MRSISRFLALLRADGVVRAATATLTPLTGGVSSEIYLVNDGGAEFIVKRALGKLKVKDAWFADTNRNQSERAYMEYVARFLPAAVPKVWGGNPTKGYFVMEYLGGGYSNWKQLLLAGHCEVAQASQAAGLLAKIHRTSRGDPQAIAGFDTTPNFRQLRIEPYLLTTGQRHPEWQSVYEVEAARLAATRECLVHGDFSPKNILINGDRMVLLDCEVAWYGDPAFDCAFLLNHFFLKALYHAPQAVGLDRMVAAFWRQYDAPGLTQRVGRLLLLLLLARVDGKSPVEYLTASKQQFIQRFVAAQLSAGRFSLDEIAKLWFDQLPTL